jgi:hypothetical protein
MEHLKRVHDESYTGDYNGEDCPNCGRKRIMVCQDGKRHCEKCWWCVEDNEYQGGSFEVEDVWRDE